MNRPPRRAALLLGLAVLLAARASDASGGADLFVGYSFAKIQDVSRHGASAALGFTLSGPVRAFVDVSAHFGSADGASRDDLTLMAGPGVRFGRQGGTVVFVRGLAGLVRDSASIGILDVTISETSSRFGLLAGGGADFPVSKALALRVQGDYLWTDVAEGTSSGFRASAGLVYRFGAR